MHEADKEHMYGFVEKNKQNRYNRCTKLIKNICKNYAGCNRGCSLSTLPFCGCVGSSP